MELNSLKNRKNDDESKIKFIQSLSFLIPANRYSINFDVTTKSSISALLESALKLLSCLDAISPEELQSYFGLIDNEREVLLDQMLHTGWAEISYNGDLVPTESLLQWRSSGQSDIQLQELKNYNESFVIDSLTGTIQPRSDDPPRPGLPLVPELDHKKNGDPKEVFSQQFRLFQQCLNYRHDLRTTYAQLYRIQQSHHDRVTTIPVSLDISVHPDSLHGIRLDASVFGFDESNKRLLENSGIPGKIVNYLNDLDVSHAELTFDDYCLLSNDKMLAKYNKDGYFDLSAYFNDRDKKKISYGDKRTRTILGPLYLAKNLDEFLYGIRGKTEEIELPPILWRPASSILWAASIRLKALVEHDVLKSRNTFTAALFPCDRHNPQTEHHLKSSYYKRVGPALCLPDAAPLDEMEIMVVPGDPGWALCQYHVRLAPDLGYKGLTIPVGYTTTDPERVNLLWRLLQERSGNLDGIKPLFGQPDMDRVMKALDDSNELIDSTQS